jgi:C1A family cysteine protease
VNQKAKTFKLGKNSLSDYDEEEWAFLSSGLYHLNYTEDEWKNFERSDNSKSLKLEQLYDAEPKTINWAESHIPLPVKYQGDKCSSCYAFAAASALEFAFRDIK